MNKSNNKPAPFKTTVAMWAVLIVQEAGDEVEPRTIRANKTETLKAGRAIAPGDPTWLERNLKNGNLRLARVIVAEEGGK